MKPSSSLRIIVTGLIAQHPSLGGVTWDYLQYPLGLARLGHDVYYFEDSGEWPYNLDGGPNGDDWVAQDCAPNVEHLATVMARFGLDRRWAYYFPTKSRWYGLSDKQRREVIASADLLINVSGTLQEPRRYRGVKRLAYIDSDPGFTQIKLAIEDSAGPFRGRVDAHDVHFTFGERSSSEIPQTGQRWQATRQPIVLTEWPVTPARRDVYTTVMSWTSYKPLRYQGQCFGQKDIEFSRFLDLPRRAPGRPFEVALNQTQHADWQATNLGEFAKLNELAHQPASPEALLRSFGWNVVDAARTCADLDSYRRYITASKAEWSVAKNGYVAARTGWFSCRSACYLAAGRPVIVQDTGFSEVLPAGEGILSFGNLAQAQAAVEAVEADYARHAAAARAIAEKYFDSATVLNRLIEGALDVAS